MKYRIAIVEDVPILRENYTDAFEKQGYQVVSFPGRTEAQVGFQSRLPDLAIIDIGLGEEVDGGFALCLWLRQRSQTLPIIFLSARDNDLDIVSGLRMGADDYLSKEVSLPHLMARVSALFRRIDVMANSKEKEKIISEGDLEVDELRLCCTWQGHALELTLTEFWMLHSLVKRVGHVKSRQQLMQDSQLFVDDGTITSHIKRIRKKFTEQDPAFSCIDTVYGMGYRWNPDP